MGAAGKAEETKEEEDETSRPSTVFYLYITSGYARLYLVIGEEGRK